MIKITAGRGPTTATSLLTRPSNSICGSPRPQLLRPWKDDDSHSSPHTRLSRRSARGSAMSEFLAATSQRPAQRSTAPVASPRSVRPHLSPRGWSARLTRSTTRSTRRFSLTNRSRRSGVVREEDCDAFLDMLRLPVGQACFARFARTDETWNRHSARSLLLCWLDVQRSSRDWRPTRRTSRRWRRRRGGARGCARAGRGEGLCV